MSNQWDFTERCYQILVWDLSQLQIETCTIYCAQKLSMFACISLIQKIIG
jgi:hypothetical protein